MTVFNVGDRVRFASGREGKIFGVLVSVTGAEVTVSLQLGGAAGEWLPADGAEIVAAAAPPDADAPPPSEPAPAALDAPAPIAAPAAQ